MQHNMNIDFSQMTIQEIKDYLSIVACQNWSMLRDYIKLHFLKTNEQIKLATVAKRINDRYKGTFKPETIVSVINTYVEMGIITKLENGFVRLTKTEELSLRDETILNNRK